ncbi:hydrophobin 2, partial [Mycena floridula]
TLAVATPSTPARRTGGGGDNEPANDCSAGNLRCCNYVLQSSIDAIGSILRLLHIEISNPSVLAGLNCLPIALAGLGAGQWQTWSNIKPRILTDLVFSTAQAVCCKDNSHGKWVATIRIVADASFPGNLISLSCVNVTL